MKKNRIIALISALLCLSMLFVSCGEPENPDEPVVENATVSDFLIYADYNDIQELSQVKQIPEEYGEICAHKESLYVFLKSSKDFMNNVTETYTLYNAETDTVVKTLSHTYADGNYFDVDDFGNIKFPPSILEVSIETERVGSYTISYFLAAHMTCERLDDEVIEENELDMSYDVKVDYFSAIDSTGLEFIHTNMMPLDGDMESFEPECETNKRVALVTFGDVKAVFDARTNKVVRYWNVGEEDHFSLFDYETDSYGYFLMAPYGSIDEFYRMKGALEVYDKETDELVIRYPYNNEAYMTSAYVLASGDVLIQSLFNVQGGEFDFFFGDENVKMNLQTLVLDIETGTVKEYPDFNYYVSDIYTKDDLKYPIEGVDYEFTDNVTNLVSAIPFETDKHVNFFDIGNSGVGMFMNSDLSVQYVIDKIHPEQDVSVEPRALGNGNILIGLATTGEKAILGADGNIRAYLPIGADIVGDSIVTDSGVYTFDMQLRYEFNFSNYNFSGEPSDWYYRGNIDEYLIFERRSYDSQNYEYSYEVRVFHIEDADEYMVEYNPENPENPEYPEKPEYPEHPDYNYHNNQYFYDARVYGDIANDYVIIYEESSHLYRMFNYNFDEIVTTTDEMRINKAEDNYVIEAGDFVFIVSEKAENNGGEEK